MARRKYQQGNVYQKGRRKSDLWLPEAPAYVQFWRDIPGQTAPRRERVALGRCRTRTIAERQAAEKLEQRSINSAQTFIETTSNITFKDQGEVWLRSLSGRKRNPLEATTITNRRYTLDKWIYPFLSDRLLADVNNRTMKELVEFMAPKLSAASIRDYCNVVKAVVASAINDDGEELFPRKWNEEFIDAPVVTNQRQPSTSADGMNAIVNAAKGQYRIMYALLAGCGPLRVGEALGLEIGRHISEDCRTLYIQQKAKRGAKSTANFPSLARLASVEERFRYGGDRDCAWLHDVTSLKQSDRLGLPFSTAQGRRYHSRLHHLWLQGRL